MPYSAEDIRTTIKMCEIDFDLVHQPTTQITRIPKVIRGFNQAADEVELGYFDKKGEFRARKRQSSVARLKSFSNKDAIRAYVREGDAWVEFFLYQKEDGELGALNRCESRFDQTALENLFKSRQFNSESEFVAKIDHLSEISFKRLYPILSFVAKNELKDWTMLRQALRMLFRNCAEEVYELLRHEGRVSTGSASNRTPKSAKLRIPKFAKFGIVFQKVNASIYRVDWKSLPHFSERFFEFKASNSKKKFVEPAATPFIIKHEKSWATTNFG